MDIHKVIMEIIKIERHMYVNQLVIAQPAMATATLKECHYTSKPSEMCICVGKYFIQRFSSIIMLR